MACNIWNDCEGGSIDDFSSSNNISNSTYLQAVVVESSGLSTKLRLYADNIMASSYVRLGLYDNGTPIGRSNKLAEGTTFVSVDDGSGYIEVTLDTPVDVVGFDRYYIAIQIENYDNIWLRVNDYLGYTRWEGWYNYSRGLPDYLEDTAFSLFDIYAGMYVACPSVPKITAINVDKYIENNNSSIEYISLTTTVSEYISQLTYHEDYITQEISAEDSI